MKKGEIANPRILYTSNLMIAKMGKKKAAVKNGGKSAKSSADDGTSVHNVGGKRKAELSRRRFIDEEDITIDEFVKT